LCSHANWQPVLLGDKAIVARELALDLANRIRRAERVRVKLTDVPDWHSRAGLLDRSHEFSLSSGVAGNALLFAYCHDQWPSEGFADFSRENLHAAIEGLESLSGRVDLWDGFTGIAWVVDHLSRHFPHIVGSSESDPNEEIDEALVAILENDSSELHYDLVSGIVGIGVYGLDRGDGATPREIVRLVIETLRRTAERDAHGTYWRTPGHLAVSEDPALFGGGFIDTGMAHGVSGVIALLARAARRQVEERTALELMRSTVDWLRAQRLEKISINCLPAKITPSFTRLGNAAWCYGDPGITAGLTSASQSANDASIEKFASEIGLRVAPFSRSRAGLNSSGLCHGSSGLALLYARLAQCTGAEGYVTAARTWFSELLAEPNLVEDAALWRDEHQFLSGPRGVVLSLLAGATSVEPAWDSVLMLPHPLPR
jgi:lantibiotic modifying enzyme